jgi:hypothetical protein
MEEVSYFIVNKLKTSQNLKKRVQKLIFPRFFTTLLPFLTRTLTANNSIFSRLFLRDFEANFERTAYLLAPLCKGSCQMRKSFD